VTEQPAPFPGPLAAIWLTAGSWILTAFVLAAFVEPLGPIAALGLAITIGLGVTGTLAARRVQPPQAERIGLRGLAPRLLLALLLLVPLALLASEVDNIVRTLMPAAEALKPPEGMPEAQAFATGLSAVEMAIVLVGLAPVVEEFFFRGVVQQGLVALGGASRGILGTAILYALGHGNLISAPAGWVSATLGSLLIGAVLGYARLVSDSLLAPILLSMAIAGTGLLSVQLVERFPIPGFNAPGDHTPVVWLLPAAVSVALGLALLVREGRLAPPPRIAAQELSPPAP
jgi:membrane protease YdiL (CAAX protease family)